MKYNSIFLKKRRKSLPPKLQKPQKPKKEAPPKPTHGSANPPRNHGSSNPEKIEQPPLQTSNTKCPGSQP